MKHVEAKEKRVMSAKQQIREKEPTIRILTETSRQLLIRDAN
jgi:hypothetical protein